MSRLLLLVGICGLLLGSSSCCEKRLYCDSGTFDFAFAGYPRQEIRSFILRKYEKENIWTTPLDSAQYVYTGASTISTKPDTLYFSDYSTTDDIRGITAGYDWAIYLPATREIFWITTIFENDNNWEMVRCNEDSKTCSKDITNFSLNSIWRNGGFAFLPKTGQ